MNLTGVQQDIFVQEKGMGVMVMCPVNVAALCRIALKNAALSLSLVGHAWPILSHFIKFAT